MLHDNSLSNLYQQIVEAIMTIFKSLGARSSQYVNQVIPQMIQITENSKPKRREFFLNQFGVLASIIRHQLQPHVKAIFELVHVSFDFTGSLGLENLEKMYFIQFLMKQTLTSFSTFQKINQNFTESMEMELIA